MDPIKVNLILIIYLSLTELASDEDSVLITLGKFKLKHAKSDILT